MRPKYYLVECIILMMFFSSCDIRSNVNETLQSNADSTTIRTHDFLRDFPAMSPGGLVNVVVEIPAGSNQKWEVEKKSGYLEWERIGDSLRVVKYLPYPANYGMIPSTWLPAHDGGDNDPLDVFLIGESVPRGSVVEARILGVIRMLDRGEQDDKLIAVTSDGHFGDVHTLDELQTNYPRVVEILTIWLANYKGEGFVEIESV